MSEGEETGMKGQKLIASRQDQLETMASIWMPSRTISVIDN